MKFLVPYKIGSKSAKLLAATLGILRLRNPTRRRLKKIDEVINWGGYLTNGGVCPEVNNRLAINVARNKFQTFLYLDGKVNIVPYTIEKRQAQLWLDDKSMVFGRSLYGYGGKDIERITTTEQLEASRAPLFTRYIKKKKEFRVHCVKGETLIQEKRKRRGVEHDHQVRNLTGGWVFCTEVIGDLPELRKLALETIDCLGLDFGAVDIIWNEKENKYYVLEVNTAPGLCQTTASFYARVL